MYIKIADDIIQQQEANKEDIIYTKQKESPTKVDIILTWKFDQLHQQCKKHKTNQFERKQGLLTWTTKAGNPDNTAFLLE